MLSSVTLFLVSNCYFYCMTGDSLKIWQWYSLSKYLHGLKPIGDVCRSAKGFCLLRISPKFQFQKRLLLCLWKILEFQFCCWNCNCTMFERDEFWKQNLVGLICFIDQSLINIYREIQPSCATFSALIRGNKTELWFMTINFKKWPRHEHDHRCFLPKTQWFWYSLWDRFGFS